MRDYEVTQLYKSLRSQVDAFKSPQRIGDSSFVGYKSNSANQSDWSRAVPGFVTSPSVQVYSRRVRVTFTHSQPTKYAIIVPSFFYRIDNSDVMSAPVFQTTASTPTVDMRIWREPPQVGVSTWIIAWTNNDTAAHTAYLKCFFYGTDKGTFTVQDIS